jgi:ABC-type polysaccharide/polyol phosphate transport system ATPase subunit
VQAQGLPAVLVDDVSKSFQIPRERVHTLKERALHPLRRSGSDELRALRHVSFSVEPGEFFGIVGRNGSGKSTLLKCLAGIYRRDEGDIYVNGRVSTFIELGVGFNMDLAARDNVMINATMLGLSRRDALSRFERVIEFAELDDFVDLKLKNYSSGMLVRLAFSVMLQVDADIMLIDEVLAVGDAAFQQKCFDEFERIRKTGTTVLLVTHDMSAVRRFCDRALLLETGRVVEIADPERVGARYLDLNFSAEARAAESASAGEDSPSVAPQEDIRLEELDRYGDGRGEVLEAWFENEHGVRSGALPSGRQCTFGMRVRFKEQVTDPLFGVTLHDLRDIALMSPSTIWDHPRTGTFAAGEEATLRFSFQNVLAQGRYTAAPGIAQGTMIDKRNRMISVVVTGTRSTEGVADPPYEVVIERAALTPVEDVLQ